MKAAAMTPGEKIHDDAASHPPGMGAALDEIFRNAAAVRPDALALIDPPNRKRFTDGSPRRLTYAQADRAISAIAARIRQMRLPEGAVVAVQLPNIVEMVLTILGIMCAGLIAAPLPILWRKSDCVAALSRSGAKAIITCGRIGTTEHGRLAMAVASRLFAIRYVCAYGNNLPDGIVGFDDIFDTQSDDPPPSGEFAKSAAAQFALVTFETGPDGPIPVVRAPRQILAGGLAPFLESAVAPHTAILASLSLDSFAGLSATLVPWLLTRGTLSLHMPFDPQVFAEQMREQHNAFIILPGTVALRMAQAGVFDSPVEIGALLAIWRAPERLQSAEIWPKAGIRFIDVVVFGEIGLLAARRGADDRPAALALGPHTAPRDTANAIKVIEVSRTTAGTIGLCGPMVPHGHFPPGTSRDGLKITDSGIVDTGYPCRVEQGNATVTITGPQAGIVSVGGYQFSWDGMQKLVNLIDRDATIAALPADLTGYRLAGHAAQRDMVRKTLAELGVNPLVIDAFRARTREPEPRRAQSMG